jgi:hypothetical protein
VFGRGKRWKVKGENWVKKIQNLYFSSASGHVLPRVGEKYIQISFMEKPEVKWALEIYIGVDGRIILKWILNNSDHLSQIFGGQSPK